MGGGGVWGGGWLGRKENIVKFHEKEVSKFNNVQEGQEVQQVQSLLAHLLDPK
jgi:hypothetical protein